MKKQSIKDNLVESHRQFTEYILALSDEEFMYSHNEKWTAGEQMDHVYRSVKALVKALALPKPTLGQMFGMADRPSIMYDEIVANYKSVLGTGLKASGKFIPSPIPLDQRDQLATSLAMTVNELNSLIDNFSEEELDQYIIPHPAMGNMTIREMLCFTIYHVSHHLGNIEQMMEAQSR